MRLRNGFETETRELFYWNHECFWCGMNGWDAAHHILGRESNSPLNFCPIHNFKCHIGNGKLNTFPVKKTLLQKTLSYLKENGYQLTEQDEQFMLKNKKYYVKESKED